jgi:ubiquinone biosynthesis O-methyltransferase
MTREGTGREAARERLDGGESASATRKSGQSAAEWQAEVFDTLMRRDPSTAFGRGPLQGVLLEKRIAFASEYAVPGAATLDVGCGNGYVARRVAEATGGRVVGIDVSAETIRYASEHNAHPATEYLQGSVEEFEPAERFGLITLYEVLEHVDDPDGLLQRLSSWLQPGGHLVLSTPNRSSLNRRIKRQPGLRWLYRRLTKRDPDRAHPQHVEEYTYDELLQMLRSAGLEVEREGGAVLLFPFPDAIGPLRRSKRFARLNVRSGNWSPRLATAVYLVGRKPS